MKIESRLLQVLLSAVSGDRVTVALVHWDGAQLRVASSNAALSSVSPSSREGVRAAIDDYVRRARRRARVLEQSPELDMGLAHAFPVREGIGAALCWTPIATRETSDPEAHFLEVRREARLEHEPLHRVRRLTERKVYDGLVSLGEQLRMTCSAGAWVRTTHSVKYKMSCDVPLSWKNSTWHHAVPFSLDGLPLPALEDELRRVFGLVELSLPLADVTVLVPAMPSSPSVAVTANRELRAMRLVLKARRPIDLIAARTTDGLDLAHLSNRVMRDIRSHGNA